MKVAILAGGFGTRLSEETVIRPKPMVEIGGRPMLWHIMKLYSQFGFNDFAVALGYKGDFIKRYFMQYYYLNSDFSIDLSSGEIQENDGLRENWKIHLWDTGYKTETGGRIKRLQPLLEDGTFMLTYGDGVSNVDIRKLVEFHKAHGKMATLTAVRPPARYGSLELEGDNILRFSEKHYASESWVNGGFFVLEPEIFQYLDGDETDFEQMALPRIASDGQLVAFKHDGFWQSMDTLRDVRYLNRLYEEGNPPWMSRV